MITIFIKIFISVPSYYYIACSPVKKATPQQSIAGGTAEDTITSAAVQQNSKCCTASNHPLKLMVKLS